ncbi:hypothetical protein JTE90_028874 [Oedothorax gibbosus]|uniref:Uncharacterized protein n=1 Tax=Oedothorax gibbosus TaxID=931172 RepID=A0AAV6TJI3_9ARAC|nr:hypothetical protein JTE90_028874 [Oedothorax gibbosus]
MAAPKQLSNDLIDGSTKSVPSIVSAKPGIVMNVVCCAVQIFMVHTLGVAIFDLGTFPKWANETTAAMNMH